MKTMKMALLAGAAVAVSTAAAHADELSDLKAQIETLNARVAAMETAPSVPAGYKLLTVSKGEAVQIPGLGYSDRDRVQNDRAVIISVLPTADAPAGTTISWSGYVRAGLIYAGQSDTATRKDYIDGVKVDEVRGSSNSNDNWDVKARGQLRVVATTDTAVGEVGVELKLRANFNGNGFGDAYMETAWGYWAMTPELTFGGGYAGSLGNIGYGYDGACTCYYTDNADVSFNPGDTTQMRLSYASGPFSMAVALEDSGRNNGFGNDDNYTNGQNLGVAGEVKYSGDAFSGEISGVWRSTTSSDYNTYITSAGATYLANIEDLWQVGAGVGFNLGDIASLSLAAALGQGPFEKVNSQGNIYQTYPVNNSWWGVSGLASANLSDTVHAEVGVGYKNRQGDGFTGPENEDGFYAKSSGFDWNQFAVLGGVYYTPVDQLTIGVEGEWYTTSTSLNTKEMIDGEETGLKSKGNLDQDNWSVDLVSVWRF